MVMRGSTFLWQIFALTMFQCKFFRLDLYVNFPNNKNNVDYSVWFMVKWEYLLSSYSPILIKNINIFLQVQVSSYLTSTPSRICQSLKKSMAQNLLKFHERFSIDCKCKHTIQKICTKAVFSWNENKIC